MASDPGRGTAHGCGRLIRLALLWLLVLPASNVPAQAPTAGDEPQRIQAEVEALGPGGVMLLPDIKLTLNQAVAQFYRQRGFEPAWPDDHRVDTLLGALHELTLDGLDPEDYRAGDIERGRSALAGTASQRADFDLLATRSYLLALTHLYRGKVDPRDFDPGRNFDARQLDPTQGLQAALAAVGDGDIASAFARARPQHPLYRGLREAMGSLRDVAGRGGWPRLPDGPALKPGVTDPRVPLLRRRIIDAGYLPTDLDAEVLDSPNYDAQLTAAVIRYQTEQYLGADGAIGPATRAALNVPVEARIQQLRVNEERARWLLHEVQNKLVVVDIAGYKLHYFSGAADAAAQAPKQDTTTAAPAAQAPIDPQSQAPVTSGEMPAWSTRVQVGKPYRMTPVFKSAIDEITFNPAWVVPPTVYLKDILPKVRRNRAYLAANRLHVFDAQWREVSPQSVDWNKPPAGLRLRQEAGPGGALGRIKISFPNPYAVYLHDTPHPELFDRGARAFSSGCIRVQQPYDLAERLFDDPVRWNRAAIDAAVAEGSTRTYKLARPVTILLAYWTVDLHENNRPAFKSDIYNLDAPLLKALNRPPH
ncbi:L,D-transpeptidase family protein [Nevskia soli]|uniref:L,D-transpeptidase family protein n=1 Tax=Nevskia soli TaxID=418856 RepID=UPI00068CB797|nr:L,D-transpeptidase family protein [Nevskia soli]